jgi:hypothetical protein
LLYGTVSYAAVVKIGDKDAFDVNYGAGNLTAAQRAQVMQKNVDNALVASADRSANSVSITVVNSQPVVTLGGFYVATADGNTAEKLGLSKLALAGKWKSGLQKALSDRTYVDEYIAKLTGTGDVAHPGTASTESGSFPFYKSGHVIFIPAGMVIPVSLTTGISSEFSKAGDPIKATLAQPVVLGDSQLPMGTVLIGLVTNSAAGTSMSHSGILGLKFSKMELPDGSSVPISAHISGKLGRFEQKNGQVDTFHGESTSQKMEDAALRGAIGAGGGALIGTVIGAISSHRGDSGRAVGKGALSGMTIGAAIGVADSLLLRKGANVQVQSGQPLNLQLDAPAQIAESSPAEN